MFAAAFSEMVNERDKKRSSGRTEAQRCISLQRAYYTAAPVNQEVSRQILSVKSSGFDPRRAIFTNLR